MYLLRRIFFVSFLLFLLSRKKKQEKPDGKRKKKKGYSRSSRSKELLNKFKIPPLATDCYKTPSANPTLPDLLTLRRLWAMIVRITPTNFNFCPFLSDNPSVDVSFLKVFGVQGCFFKSTLHAPAFHPYTSYFLSISGLILPLVFS